ncbi:MAG: hypothetical protein ACREH5_02605 [Candidatus Omnitrophota bacterium]
MDNIEKHIKNYLAGERKEVPPFLVEKAKALMPGRPGVACPHCGKPITPFKKPIRNQTLWNALWLILAAGSFALSFLFPGYFVQCVALAFLFGVKWIVDQRAAKTQVLIYKALQEEVSKEPAARDLHRSSSHL